MQAFLVSLERVLEACDEAVHVQRRFTACRRRQRLLQPTGIRRRLPFDCGRAGGSATVSASCAVRAWCGRVDEF